jgi:hypothetical protein
VHGTKESFMRRFFSSVFGLRAKPSRIPSRPAPRRVCLSVDPLEQRLLLDGFGVFNTPLLSGQIVSPPPQAGQIVFPWTGTTVGPAGGLGGELGPGPAEVLDPTNDPTNNPDFIRDQQLGLPMLDSLPGAPVTLHLDFTGNEQFAGDLNGDGASDFIRTPVFRRTFNDPNPAKFNAAEQALITEIWARVAEDYAPFNINVTTHYYGGYEDGQALKVAIGGDNTDPPWNSEDISGKSLIGSFSNSNPNVVFVFDLVAWERAGVEDPEHPGRPLDGAAATATTISHEAGHAFGLQHHSLYRVDGTMITEYNPGGPGWTPIMGENKASDRTTWDAGPTILGPNTYQDDLAILGGSKNGFGFRADDHGNTTATATPLSSPGPFALQRLTGQGIINDWQFDRDFFKFTTAGGAVQVQVDAARFGPNLIPVAELWSDAGLVARANAGGLTQSIINASVPAGTYYVLVKGFGDYGDMGQYTVTVDFPKAVTQDAALNVTPPPGPAAVGLKLKAQAVKLKAQAVKLKAQAVKLKGRWQVQAFDAVGNRKFVRTLPKAVLNRPEVSVVDLNRDGRDDLLITYKVGKKKVRLVLDGLTGAPVAS